MRKTALAIVMLAALLVCCLIAGTPVNNDVSREATTAGIHLTPPPSSPRAASTAVAPLLEALAVTLLVLAARRRCVDVTVLPATDVAPMRSLLRARAGSRRGPPAFAV